jgi:tRNA pseudouridine38-40 synthase
LRDKNINLVIAYDGGRYHGWQRQKKNLTVQGVIEDKLQTLLGQPAKLQASGRTDAGVHAFGQVANFKTSSKISVNALKRGLQSLLPDDIIIKQVEYVSNEFHARYSAISKVYEYSILNREEPDIFRRHYVWHIYRPLNLEMMSKCLSLLTGRHDFSSFKSTGSNNTDPVRTVIRADLLGPFEDGVMKFVIEADGFLRHMVRNIVGTLVDVGLEKIDLENFEEIFKLRDRRLAGIKAPPQGLFLVRVKYDNLVKSRHTGESRGPEDMQLL